MSSKNKEHLIYVIYYLLILSMVGLLLYLIKK